MASSFQQQALQRKLIYLGLVVVLFSAAWGWRRYGVEAHAEELGIREQSVGEVEVVGSAVRLSLVGLRGIAMTTLWYTAIEKKERHQWNELELVIRTITKLQPHFITPWQFQGWNLAYNVSVESDRIRDKYFYVTRGIQLLAEGERKNRFRPELRRDIGMFTEHKVMKSDENNYMRSLFQLSCIPPIDRHPTKFWRNRKEVNENGETVTIYLRKPNGAADIDWQKYKEFCLAHPQLVRRLYAPPLVNDPRREFPKFSCENAEEVLRFLGDNYDVPGLFANEDEDEQRYSNKAPKQRLSDRFPVLPPKHRWEFSDYKGRGGEWDDVNVVTRLDELDSFDAFHVGRAWYSYAVEALPPPHPEFPFESAEIPYQQRRFKRVPQHMQTVLYRSTPARTQSFVAERLDEEGWFGGEKDGEKVQDTSWVLEVKELSREQAQSLGGRTWTLDGRASAQTAWRDANNMWQFFGERNHLILRSNELTEKTEQRRKFFDHLGIPEDTVFDIDRETYADPELERLRKAVKFLQLRKQVRHTINFVHFLTTSEVEQENETVRARKLFYVAERIRRERNAPATALKMFDEAASALRVVLDKEDLSHRRFREDGQVQEYVFEKELKFVLLYQELYGVELKQHLGLQCLLGQTLSGGGGSAWTLPGLFLDPQRMPQLTVKGPFAEDKSDKREPYFTKSTRESVLRELRLDPSHAQTVEGAEDKIPLSKEVDQ